MGRSVCSLQQSPLLAFHTFTLLAGAPQGPRVCNFWSMRKVEWMDWEQGIHGARVSVRQVTSEAREAMLGVHHGSGKDTVCPLLLPLYPHPRWKQRKPQEFSTATAHKETCTGTLIFQSPPEGWKGPLSRLTQWGGRSSLFLKNAAGFLF